MAAELSNQIDWDGQALYIEAATDGGPVTCKVPRDTIHIIRSIVMPSVGRFTWRGIGSFRSSLPFCERNCPLPRPDR
jgi:hypothetical protein